MYHIICTCMSIRRIVQASVNAHTYRMQHIVVFSILPVRGHAHFHSSGLVIPNTLQHVIATLATMLRMRKKYCVHLETRQNSNPRTASVGRHVTKGVKTTC